MKRKQLRSILGGLGVFFILCSLIPTVIEYNRYTASPLYFAPESMIAGIPIGGLDETEAETRLSEFYSLPLVLTINGATIHSYPGDLGFTIDPQALVAEAAQKMHQASFWEHLWNMSSTIPVEIPLIASANEDQVLNYLNTEIIPRYPNPGRPVLPIIWTPNFEPGHPRQNLNVEQAVTDISTTLLTPTDHHVSLHLIEAETPEPEWELLEAFLRHNLNWAGFNQVIEVYLESLETGETLQFALQNGVIEEPNIAFPAASTNKIPIMISVLRRTSEPTPEQVITLFYQMIGLSENPPADALMSTYLNQVRGPLIVSEDMAALGMENTFLGMFYTDPTPLALYDTPANTRQDVFLAPDRFNQTIPAEAGELLSAIYGCAQGTTSLLTETFPGEITPSECQLMIDTLASNRIGLLIEAGVSYEAAVAHKHGWATDLDGQLRFMSDVGIVFSPGGDYVLNIFLHDPLRLDFDEGNRVIARLSQTVYNFFNLENQVHWWFD